MSTLPPLPPGFKLDAPAQQDLPPLPPGFTLDTQARADPFAGDDMLSNEAMSRAATTAAPDRNALPAFRPTLSSPISHAAAGVLEAGTTLLTGAAAPFLASVKKIPEAFGRPEVEAPTNEEIAEFVRQPRSPIGRSLVGAIGTAVEPVAKVVEKTGADVALLPLSAEMQAFSSIPRVPKVPKAPKASKVAPQKVPSTDELASAAKQAYTRAKEAGAVAAPQGYARMASGMRGSLREQGFNPKLHPKAAAVVEEIESAGTGQPVSFDELEILRRQALAAERSIEADERRVAGLIIDRLDDYADALASGAEPVLGGNAPAAVAARKEARNLYSRSRKAMEIEELMERAKVRASQFSGSGEENALRTEFRQLALNQKRLRRFSQEEQKAIKDVAFGNNTRNALRQIGKLAPTGGLSQWLAIGGTLLNPAVAAVPITGALARAGATRLTRRAAERAGELMRRGPTRQAAEESVEAAPEANRFAQLAPADDIERAGDAFDTERAASAAAARGGYEVEELPASAVQSITLETTPNRLQQLEGPQRAAARAATASRTQSPPTVKQIESEMRAMERRAAGLPSDSPELLEMDALYQTLKEELALAKQRTSRGRNRIERLAPGER